MKNTAAIFFVSLLLLEGILMFISPPVISGGISACPAKLTITMPEGFPEETIKYTIQVNNLNSYVINVSATVDNPIPHRLKKNYTFIPDLSWVEITPDLLYIPPHESAFFEILINIPDEEKPLHYNERWEVWAVVSEVKNEALPGTIDTATKLAIRFFIHTPPEKVKQQIPQTLYLILLFIIVGLIITATFVFYAKKRERITYKKRPVVLYFKKKKGGGSRNNRP